MPDELTSKHILDTITVQNARYEWDDVKAKTNFRKHRVTFNDACQAIEDPYCIVEIDDGPDEERWHCIGRSDAGILFVVHTARGFRTRIISARPAAGGEVDRYFRQAVPEK